MVPLSNLMQYNIFSMIDPFLFQLQNIEKEISVEKNQSTKPTKMPWHGWIRNRPGLKT